MGRASPGSQNPLRNMMPFPQRRPKDQVNRNRNSGGGGAAGAAPKQGLTYYPVNPLGPHTGPTAANFPNGQLITGAPAPAPTPSAPIPSPGVGGSSLLSNLWNIFGRNRQMPNTATGFNSGVNSWLSSIIGRRQV